MNVENGTDAVQFLFWEYKNGISLQCSISCPVFEHWLCSDAQTCTLLLTHQMIRTFQPSSIGEILVFLCTVFNLTLGRETVCINIIGTERRAQVRPPSSMFNPFLFIRGLSCPSCIQALLSLKCLKLIIPGSGFPHNCLPVSCGDTDTGFKKILGLILAWKTGLKVPFLPLGRSCPLQNILLCDLVGSDSPLQIVMAFLAHHFCQQRTVTPDPESLNSNKKGRQTTISICRGVSHPTGWAVSCSDF